MNTQYSKKVKNSKIIHKKYTKLFILCLHMVLQQKHLLYFIQMLVYHTE